MQTRKSVKSTLQNQLIIDLSDPEVTLHHGLRSPKSHPERIC